jgi:outer membrane receptor protein involved in Fe transport
MRTLWAAFVAVSITVGADASAQSTGTGGIIGTVRGQDAQRAVPNATVTIEGTTVTAMTDSLGGFRLDGIAPGQAVLTVRARGFLDLRIPGVRIEPSTATRLTVELTAAPNVFERVQVTATKEPIATGEVAAQTDAIDRSTIDSRGDQTLSQAIAHVPGAVVSTQLGIFDSVMLRGMPRGDPEFTNTLLLVDGVPQTLSNNGARIVALPIGDAGTIEVVRGPNSALYGRTAIGGAINVLTADPTATTQASVELTGGEFGMAKGLLRASGPLKRWGGYYVSGGGERNGGYFVNKTSTKYSDNTKTVFGKLTFTPGARTFGTLSVNHVDSENSTPTNEPIVDGELLHVIDPRFDRFTTFNIPGPNYDQRETRVTARVTHALAPWANVVEVFGYRDVQHNFVIDGDFLGSPFDLDAHTVSMFPFSQKMNEHIAYEEARLELAPRGTHMRQALTLGGSYERNSGKLFSDFIYNDPDLFGFTINYLNPVIPPSSEWQHDASNRLYHLGVTGIFGQYTLEPTNRVVLTAAGRYDRLALDNTRDDGDRIDATFDAFSPKVSATLKAVGADGGRSTLNVYGVYSQSFLPPRRPSSLIPSDAPLKLKPEDIANYEGGVKGTLGGGRVSLEATYFRMTEDGVVLTTRQGPFFLPTNSGKLRYKGVETGASVAVTPKASVFFNASVYRNRFADFVIESDTGDEDLTGNRLPISPDYVINWGAAIHPTSAIDVTLNVKHLGSVQADRENTFTLASYGLVDAAVSWRHGVLGVTLSAHNLFNTEYYWNADGETADPGRPRQVLVTTRVRIK